MNVQEANALRGFQGKSLVLNGLKAVSDEFAEALTGYQGSLYLNGIQQSNPSLIQLVNHFQGDALYLNGLQALDSELLKTVAHYQGKPFLDQLSFAPWDRVTSLHAQDLASLLEHFHGVSLSLYGVKNLTPSLARQIATSQTHQLSLGLRSLDAEMARFLAQYQGELYLDTLEVLDHDTAMALAHFQGKKLSLKGIKKLTDHQIRLFAKHRDRYEFSCSLGNHQRKILREEQNKIVTQK